MVDSGQDRPVIWRPNSRPQHLLISCPVYEVFFGGARGGGKTDGIIGEWLHHAQEHGAAAIGLMVRRTSKQLVETWERLKLLTRPLGARLVGSPETGGMTCTMPDGARLRLAHLERDSDAEHYQGHSYTRVYVEEAGNFPSPDPILKLHATLRSGAGVPCMIRLTGNPGGPGHHWLRSRYIDPAPCGMEVITDPETGLQRIYIPSRVTDNPAVGAAYVQQLRAIGSPQLVRAWLDGDWTVIAGAFFPEFTMDKHVIAPIPLPRYWHRFRSFDWGSARPFSCQWWAVSDGELADIPRGALVCYREWYGMQPGRPNHGLRLTAEEVADGIAERERQDGVIYGVADPAIFTADGGPSIAERMSRRGVSWRPADNARVGRNGAMGGWDQVRSRLKGDGERPAIYFFATCVDAIRTLPALQHDEMRPEDVDTDNEDHAADSIRYACLSRPYTAPLPMPDQPEDRYARRRREPRTRSAMAA